CLDHRRRWRCFGVHFLRTVETVLERDSSDRPFRIVRSLVLGNQERQARRTRSLIGAVPTSEGTDGDVISKIVVESAPGEKARRRLRETPTQAGEAAAFDERVQFDVFTERDLEARSGGVAEQRDPLIFLREAAVLTATRNRRRAV